MVISKHQKTAIQNINTKSVISEKPMPDYKNLNDHECEGRKENFVQKTLSCRVMTNGDPGDQIFLPNTLTNNGFSFLLTIKFYIFI